MGDHAYFYDADNAAAWRVDIATGQVDAQFEPWFNQNAGQISRLWQDLASVANGRATLAVFGIKGTDGKSLLPVWYHRGQVIVASAPLQDKRLQFLGFEVDGSGARLFEPASGKLYRQPPMTADALAVAFGADEVLEVSSQLPAAGELASGLHLKAVEQVHVGLRLTTVKGEILLQTNDGKLQLVAVDKGWQQDNFARLSQALAEVAGKWRTKGVLTLQGDDTQGWFDVGSGQVFSYGSIRAKDNLRFIGIAAGKKGAYVYSPADQALYRVKDDSVQKLNHYTSVERIGLVRRC